MRIGVDAERLRAWHTGLGQYCDRLCRELLVQRPTSASLTFLVPRGLAGVFGDSGYVEATRTGRIRGFAGYDLWHVTHQDSRHWPRRSVRTILTIHDLNFFERSDYGRLRRKLRLHALQRRVDRATAITAISHYTASVAREHLDLGGRTIHVIHNGNPLEEAASGATSASADHATSDTTPAPAAPRVFPAMPHDARPFFLFVGTLHPRKNVHVLLPVLRHFPAHRLVLAGNAGHPYVERLRADARRFGVADRVEIAGAVSDATRCALYSHCDALLFPSVAEGFGLPVIEAMSFGRPVFLARATSLPEVGGSEAYYFDGFDPEPMAEVIRHGLAAFAADPLAAARVRRHASHFRWSRAVAEYWALYSRTIEGVTA